MTYKTPLLLGSFLVFASSALAAPLISLQELEPASPVKPALIQTSLSPEISIQYCHLILLTEQNLNSLGYSPQPHETAWKKARFAPGSQLLITEPKSFGEWIITTVVDDSSGALEYRIPADAAKDVVCESGAYVLGDNPLVVTDLVLFKDTDLQIEACTLPSGPFDGTTVSGANKDLNAKIFEGPMIQTLCGVETAYGSFRAPIIRPRSRH